MWCSPLHFVSCEGSGLFVECCNVLSFPLSFMWKSRLGEERWLVCAHLSLYIAGLQLGHASR